MFYEQTEEIIELDRSFEKIENAKKSIDFNLREKSKGLWKFDKLCKLMSQNFSLMSQNRQGEFRDIMYYLAPRKKFGNGSSGSSLGIHSLILLMVTVMLMTSGYWWLKVGDDFWMLVPEKIVDVGDQIS